MATVQIESDPFVDNRLPRNPPKIRRSKHRRSCAQWWKILPLTYKFFLIVVFLVVLLVSYLYIQKFVKYFIKDGNEAKFIPNPEYPLPPSASILHQCKKNAVCSDSEQCSKIGSDILNQGGNVVDAAIATLFCNGIETAQSMGIGGGFVMNLYNHTEKRSYSLNSKETAPLNASINMFKTWEEYQHSPLSIGIPGEVKGYWELHKKYGSMPWKSLINPSIKVCEEGFKVTKHMSEYISPKLFADNHFRKVFFVNGTNTPRRQGEHVKLHSELCDTYKLIAENGGDDFYNGTLADLIVDDLRDLGSIITKKDLESYKTQWEDSLSVPLSNNTVYVTPSGGGILVGFILNILRGYNMTPESIATEDERIRTYHRIVESFKYAFGYRTQLNNTGLSSELVRKMLSTEFGNEIREKINDKQTSQDQEHYGGKFQSVDDKGTSHISIIAPNGDAISITSSINYFFGIGQTGKRTGIIFNSAVGDFAVPKFSDLDGLPPAPSNFLAPRKRPNSSVSPTIVTDSNGDVQFVLGAAGGTRIPTSISMIIARVLWFGQDIKEAVDAPRIHHQLMPMELAYEYGNIQQLISGLEALGHKTSRYTMRGSVVCALTKNQTGIFGNADYRKAGEVAGI